MLELLKFLPKPLKPVPVIIICDAGKDRDDEEALVAAYLLQALGYIHILAIITDVTPAYQRARLVKGTAQVLHLGDVPIAYNHSTRGKMGVGHNAYEFKAPYLAPNQYFPSAYSVLHSVLSKMPDDSVTILGITSLAVLDEFMTRSPDLVRKIKKLVLMSGLKLPPTPEDSYVAKLADLDLSEASVADLILNDKYSKAFELQMRLFEPDTAANNAFNMPSSTRVFKRFQKLFRKPIIMLTRHASMATQLPVSHTDNMAATGHPVGIRIKNIQEIMIQHLWFRANLPPEVPEREGLPARCDRAWFVKAFLGGIDPGIQGTDSVWPYILGFMPYDVEALFLVVDEFVELFFAPYEFDMFGTTHQIVGVSPDNHGVKDPEGFKQFLAEFMVTSLKHSLEQS